MSTKIKLHIAGNTIEVTPDDARKLYDDLVAIFAPKLTIPYAQYEYSSPPYAPMPTYPTQRPSTTFPESFPLVYCDINNHGIAPVEVTQELFCKTAASLNNHNIEPYVVSEEIH